MLLNNFAVVAGAIIPLASAGYQTITNFGLNPTNVGFKLYTPAKIAAKPPVLVFPHWCHGSADAAYQGSQWATLSEKYGFVVIYPDSPNTADKCWDLSSMAARTHNGGGDTQGIVSMVQWALKQFNGDAKRVFSSGISSGAMMTTQLLAVYPEVFAAGAAFAGVPFGCFAGNGVDVWGGDCATGNISKTADQWAGLVKAAYPGYNGWRPKHMILHGTVDEVLNYEVFGEEIKQWTSVFGFSTKPTATVSNNPVSGWTKTVYGPSTGKDADGTPSGKFEAFSAANVTHNISNQENLVLGWFDLSCTSGSCYQWGSGSGSGNGSYGGRS